MGGIEGIEGIEGMERMEGIEYMDQKSCHSLPFASNGSQIRIVSHSEPKVQKIKSIDAFNLSIYL